MPQNAGVGLGLLIPFSIWFPKMTICYSARLRKPFIFAIWKGYPRRNFRTFFHLNTNIPQLPYSFSMKYYCSQTYHIEYINSFPQIRIIPTPSFAPFPYPLLFSLSRAASSWSKTYTRLVPVFVYALCINALSLFWYPFIYLHIYPILNLLYNHCPILIMLLEFCLE